MEAYFDYNATTPLDPRVFEAMKPFLSSSFGNASSFHQKGQAARHAVEAARETIADFLEVEPGDLVFTSGGTESDNLAVRGAVMEHLLKRRHLAVSAIEHQAVLHTAQHLEKRGVRVSTIPVDGSGIVQVSAIREAVTDETAVLSLMHVNNETGVIQPISEAAKIAHAKAALFHVDAVQSLGKLSVHPEDMGIDLLTISAHKICGPKGAGALYIRKGAKVQALLHGGHQEKNIRPGTENVAAIVGFGKAVELLRETGEAEKERIRKLRDRLQEGLKKAIPDIRLNGDEKQRVYNTLNLSFPGLDGETLLMNLDLKNIYVSTGSACTAGSVEPSHVLLAMGIPKKLARAAIRFSLGRFTASEEVDYALKEIPPVIERLRKASTERAHAR
ncbi:MAG: cysteine desulfurase [Candidatus Omnitrophica bacterium]|nr:cysteine desulfurase [Candidatus Omnitrophota bacterium]